MPAQVAHLGLVAGMSWVPVQLLSVLRLTETRGAASRLRWIAVLAGTFGLTILAGEPRAIADAAVIVVIYAAWRVTRLGRRSGPAAVSVAAGSVAGGLVLGICLGAVQWLPGLAVIGTSQRGASTVALFDSGSLPHRWLLLMLVPDLLGGSGSLGQPAFFANYNLAEVTGYAGILPLVAAAALLGRLRLRPRAPRVGHLARHGARRVRARARGQHPRRVPARPPAALRGAAAAEPQHSGGGPGARRPFRLLGRPAAQRQSRRFLRAPGGRRVDLETVLGLLPALAMIVVVVLGLTWGAGLLHWLRAGPGAAGAAGPLRPWLVPYALIGAGAIAFVVFGGAFSRGCAPAGSAVSSLLTWSFSRFSAWSRSFPAWAAAPVRAAVPMRRRAGAGRPRRRRHPAIPAPRRRPGPAPHRGAGVPGTFRDL